VDAGVKFGTSFPEHPDSAGVLTRAAEDIFAAQDLQRSIEVANLVLAHQPPADQPKRRIAYTIIGQANFDLLQFAEAEKGYIAARDLLPPNDKMHADLTERIAQAVYRQGEAKQKSGDSLGAVDDFLRISQVAGTSKIAAQAEYDAGAQLITSRNGRVPSRCWNISAPTTRRVNSRPMSPASSRWLSARLARPARPRWSSNASR
jgi:tetratricopeptide (TPR) repeat protein